MSGLVLAAPRAFAVVLFFVLWLAIGREDFLYQKVKNRRLSQGAAAVAGGYGVLALALLCVWPAGLAVKFLAAFLRLAAMNVVLCAAAAVLLWYFKVWPAGDVKLFVLLSALLPLTMPFRAVDYWRVFFSALVNIFLPAQVFVFGLAVHYFVRSRLVHGRRFLVQLGWRKELRFLWDSAKQMAAAFVLQTRTALAPYVSRPSLSWEAARKMAGHLQSWLLGMAAMALLSAWARQWVESSLVLSIGCTLIFASWGKVRQQLGRGGGLLAAAAVIALLKYKSWGPFSASFDWNVFFSMFGQIGVFGFFMYLGMNAMTQSFNGGSAAAMYVLPLVSALAMMALGQVFSFVARMLQMLWGWLVSFHTLGLGALLPGGLAANMPAVLPGGLAAHVHPPAWIMPMAQKGGVLAGFGLFFGLSLVLVRRWDQESRPTWRSDGLVPRLLLAPDFVEKLREDEDFFSEHFETMYPDGLTESQAEALGAWCRENAVAEVPLAPTLSFASWIFFGYLLVALFGGRHLLDFVTL